MIHTGAIASRATDGTIHSPATSGAALGSALRAVGMRTPINRQELEIAREAATAETLAVTAPDQGAGDLVVIALEATIERVSTGASTTAIMANKCKLN